MEDGAAAVIGATFCSGIGAPELAAPWIDWRLASEIEAFPREVLKVRFGHQDVRRTRGRGRPALWGDFTALRPRHFARLGIEVPDIIVAGTPCQAFSLAGLRRGFDDARGNLTLDFVRSVNAIDNLRRHRGQPGLLGVWENVPGVLSMPGNPFGCFLAALAGCDAPLVPPGGARWTDAGVVAGPRRSIAWRLLDAQYFGLAQRRERLFLVFGPVGWPCADALFPVGESVRRHPPARGEAGQAPARPLAAGTRSNGGYRNDADTADNLIAGTLSADGKAAGSATGQDAAAGLLVVGALAFGGNNQAGPIDVATARNAHAGPHGRLDFETETFVVAFSAKDAGQDAGHVSSTLRAMGHDGSHPNGGGQVAIAYRTTGNDGAYETRDHVGALGTGTDRAAQLIAFDTTQVTSPHNRSNPQPGAPCHAIAAAAHPPAIAGSGVRRLMPVECERLQGLPDDFTNIIFRGKPAADGPRYKAIGNSMAGTVIGWVLERVGAVAGARVPLPLPSECQWARRRGVQAPEMAGAAT